MTTLSYPKTVAALLRALDSLLVVAPQAAFEDGSFLEALPEEHMRLALDLASDLAPGDMGDIGLTLTRSSPRKLGIGMLPNNVSRHLTPSRAPQIAKVVAQTSAGKKGAAGVLLVLDDAAHVPAAVAAVARTLPLYTARSSNSTKSSLAILCMGRDGSILPVSNAARAVATRLREIARLVDTPPSEMDPAEFQKAAWALTRGMKGVTRSAIVGEKLVENGLGGIYGVGKAAVSPPRLLVLSHKPARASKRHIALVGKGVTYDTGGLSIKATAGMCGMKADMGGAAAVLGAFLALVDSGTPHAISAVLCLAENAIGPEATKNDDVLRLHSGKTVEINNTDAEGRLLLGDGVSWAARKLHATHVIDAATLTGAQLVATGKMHAGIVCDDEGLERILLEAGRTSGDLVHALPFAPELYRREFASPIADMMNSVADRMNAQSSCAATFVYSHIEGTGAKWGHVDLAGPAFINGRATGYGVGLLVETVRSIS